MNETDKENLNRSDYPVNELISSHNPGTSVICEGSFDRRLEVHRVVGSKDSINQ